MKEKKALIAFLILTFALSSVIYVLWIRGGEAASKSGISALLMWCPAVAAFAVRGVFYRKEKLLGFQKCRASYVLLAILIPVLYLGISYGIYWAACGLSFVGNLGSVVSASAPFTKSAGNQTLVITITLIIAFASSILTAMGEEIGWRGFLLPQMAKLWNTKTAVLVSGLIWAFWHMPIIIAGLYLTGIPLWFVLPMFTVEILAITVIMAFLRIRSKSIWPAILLHASHNYFDQVVFGSQTGGENRAYFIGETGVLTCSVLMLTAAVIVLYWVKAAKQKAAAQTAV